MKCYYHPDTDASGMCTNCGRTVCSVCAIESGGKILCKPCVEMLANKAAATSAAPQAVIVKKEPIFSLALSLLGGFCFGFIGLGQMYNGQVKKGIALTVLNWVIGTIVAVMYVLGCFTVIGAIVCLPLFLIPLVLWVYAIYDAYKDAKKINSGETVKDWFG